MWGLQRRNMSIKLCAFADEASVDLQGQIKALKRNEISLLEIRGVDGQNIKDIPHTKIKEIKKKIIICFCGAFFFFRYVVSVHFSQRFPFFSEIFVLTRTF